MRRWFFASLWLCACTEYEVTSKLDADDPLLDTATDETTDPEDSGDTDEPVVEGCPEPNTDRGTETVDDSCLIEAVPGGFTPVVEWANSSPGSAYTTPAIGPLVDTDGDGDVDGSDMPHVVVVGTGGLVTAVTGDGSTVVWTYNIASAEPSAPAIGDINNDGLPEVVVTGSNGFFAFAGATGALLWSNASSGLGTLGVCGGVGIYDLDGDGTVEIVQGRTILNGADGTLRGNGLYGSGTGFPGGTYAGMGVAADINQDGALEVVVGNAIYDSYGTALWHNGQTDGFVAVANFDDDPYGEIVVTDEGVMRLQDHDGSIIWSANYTGSRIGPPTVADFDGDGEPEIGVAGNGVYLMIDGDGTQMWSNTVQDYSSGFTGSAVFDFEGDGAAEVVYADEENVWVYDGATGAVKLQETQHASATCSEYPAIADIDLDGQAEIIYTSSAYSSGSENGVRVIGDADGSWMPARPVWNQHAYSITHVNNDASIPATTETNWLSYNSFRSGDLAAAAGGAMSDATVELVEICTEECDEGLLRIVVRIGNGGVQPIPAGMVGSLYARVTGGWSLLETKTTAIEIMPARTTPGWVFDVDPDRVPLGVVRFVADDDGGESWLTECHEDNNELIINDGLCPPPAGE